MGGRLAIEFPSGLKHSCGLPVTKRLLLQFPVQVIRKRHVEAGSYEAWLWLATSENLVASVDPQPLLQVVVSTVTHEPVFATSTCNSVVYVE